MRFYECTVIICPELSKQQIEQVYAELTEIITSQNGEVSNYEYWGSKSLAYPIEKFTRAHYFYFNMKAAPETVIELERKMRIREDILRYLTIKIDALRTEPTVIMQAKNKDDARKEAQNQENAA